MTSGLFRAGHPMNEMHEKMGSEAPTGGADRDRTDDLRLAKPALSQLSYSPESGSRIGSSDAFEAGGPG